MDIRITNEKHHYNGYDPAFKWNVWRREGDAWILIDVGNNLGGLAAYYKAYPHATVTVLSK